MEHTNFEGYTNFIDEIDDEQFDNFFSKKARRKRAERKAERRGISQLVLMYNAKGLSKKQALLNAMRDIGDFKRQRGKLTPTNVGNLIAQLRRKMGSPKDTPMSKRQALRGRVGNAQAGDGTIMTKSQARNVKNRAIEEELMPESPASARPQEELMPESPASARPPRKNRKKYIDKALIKIRGAIKNSQANTDDDDVDLRGGGIAPIEKTSLSGKNADSFFQKNKMPILVVGGLVVAGFVYFKFIKK